jgi:hypothetical protein
MLTVNELLHDKAIEHAIGLVRYSSATVRRIIALLNRTDPDIVAQIQARVGDINNVTDDRLAALLAAIRDLNRRAYEAVSKALEGDLIELAHYEAELPSQDAHGRAIRYLGCYGARSVYTGGGGQLEALSRGASP